VLLQSNILLLKMTLLKTAFSNVAKKSTSWFLKIKATFFLEN